jgi:UDP-N-acetylmuramoyl-tripeptide--D-alanyl-D-alanine ligase
MMRTLAGFAAACGGRLQGEDRSYSQVSTDSRTLERGELFVALRGPHFNGNEFVPQAYAAGAAGAVVDARRAALARPL